MPRRSRLRTKTSRSQLFHYFPGGKAELLRVAAARVAERSIAEQQPDIEDLDNWPAWQRWRDQLVERFGQPELCAVGALFTQVGRGDPAIDAIITASLDEQRQRFQSGLAAMRARGEIAENIDPAQTAVSLVATLQGGVILMRAIGSPSVLAAALDGALAALRRP